METKGALGGSILGGIDIALGRCDTNGNIEWLGQYGTSENDCFYHSLIGPSDSIITVGFTAGSFFGANMGGKRCVYYANICRWNSSGRSSIWNGR